MRLTWSWIQTRHSAVIPPAGCGLRADVEHGLALVDPDAPAAAARLLVVAEHGAPRAVLVTVPGARGVFVDGVRPLGVAPLGDRAELLVGGVCARLHAFAPPAATDFPAGHGAACCAVCGAAFAPGDRVLECPGCHALHHEGALGRAEGGERCCLAYRGGRCAGCERPLTADGGEEAR